MDSMDNSKSAGPVRFVQLLSTADSEAQLARLPSIKILSTELSIN